MIRRALITALAGGLAFWREFCDSIDDRAVDFARHFEPIALEADDDQPELFDQDDPCIDPNAHFKATGCERCRRTLQSIRDYLKANESWWLPPVPDVTYGRRP